MCVCVCGSVPATFQDVTRFQLFVESDTYAKMGMEAKQYEPFVKNCLTPFKVWLDTRANSNVSQLVEALSELVKEINRMNEDETEQGVIMEALTAAIRAYTSKVDLLESKLAKVEKDDASQIKAVLNAWLQLQTQRAIYSPNTVGAHRVEGCCVGGSLASEEIASNEIASEEIESEEICVSSVGDCVE